MAHRQTTKRAKNFLESEKNYLFEIIRDNYLNIVENKQTDTVSVEKKRKAWQAITHRYNCNAQTGPRTAKQLQYLYDTLKRTARKKLDHGKKEMCQTGRESFYIKTEEPDAEIVEILQFDPLQNNSTTSDLLALPGPSSSGDALGESGETTTEEHRQSTSPSLFLRKRKLSQRPKPKNYAKAIAKRLIGRKNTKDRRDEELAELKKKILQTELQMKEEELEHNRQKYELDIKIKEVELEIKLGELNCD